ncbi:MAG: hypothetical protein AAGD22_09590 [Verrucomicrobiota bacterium]
MQQIEDRLIERFCDVKRRLQYQTNWTPESKDIETLQEEIRETILFYETRGFYLFQEPKVEHEPVAKRFRIHLTFRPTESNQ